MRVASSIYCLRGGEVLLLRRIRPPFAGYWVAPGGKLDRGESPYEAAQRELREESGLDARELILRGIILETSPRPEAQWLIFYFVATQFVGELSAESPEGTLAWWPKDRILDLPVPEADRRFTGPILDLSSPLYQAHFHCDEANRLTGFVEHRRPQRGGR